MSDLIRVALADDHALFRHGMQAMLQDLPDVFIGPVVANGQALLDALATDPVDVVLLDLEMPVLDGMQTLPLLLQQHPAIKVLMLTMYDQEYFIARLLELGAHGYLTKDAEFDVVGRAIRQVVAEGYYLDARASAVLLNALKSKPLTTPTPTATPTRLEESLTEREQDVLRLICEECTTSEIADRLCLSPRTIEGYRNRLLEKTGAKNTAGLVVYAAQKGWLKRWNP